MNLNILKSLIPKYTERDIAKKLGDKIYIRNGIGYGFISSPELYHNQHLEIGFGRTRSGYGDWGGGFEYSSTCPLKIVIDSEYNIISTETDSFFNSKNSKSVERTAKTIQKRLRNKLHIADDELKQCIDAIFAKLPAKEHIGMEIGSWDFEHAMNRINDIDPNHYSDYRVEDADPLKISN